jgi:acetate kinase
VLLVLNAGSSSVKFAAYAAPARRETGGGPDGRTGAREPDERMRGQVDGIGGTARLAVRGEPPRPVEARDHAAALDAIVALLAGRLGDAPVAAVGHRIVHGGTAHAAPVIIDDRVLGELEALVPLAPLHQPHNIAGVLAARRAFPGATQLACFDTAFHRGHPFVNDAFALPRKLYDEGVRRYGFHGLSYEFVAGEVARRHPALAAGRLVIAHLGNGASMCAVRDGRSLASTMGFSALDGLPMGTRCGQLDPGVLLYLMGERGMSLEAVAEMLYRESGLKGLSGLSHDMRELEAADTPAAREAIDYFVFRIRREIGAMAAALGGLDGLVFCGGIGENAAGLRARVCEGLGFLGLTVDEAANARGAGEIGAGPARILVVPTDEERVIARALVARQAAEAREKGAS